MSLVNENKSERKENEIEKRKTCLKVSTVRTAIATCYCHRETTIVFKTIAFP